MPDLQYVQHGKWHVTGCQVHNPFASPETQWGGLSTTGSTGRAPETARGSARPQDTEVCQMFSLAEEGKSDNWRMLAVEVPPTSSVSVEVGSIITLKAVNRFREQVQSKDHRQLPSDMLGKDEFTLAVRKGDDAGDEAGNWEWTNTFKVRRSVQDRGMWWR